MPTHAGTYERRERAMAFHLIPLFTHSTNWVVCGTCGTRLLSKRPVAELAGLSPEELAAVVVRRAGLPQRLLAVAAVLFGFWPILGLLVTVPAVVVNLRTPGWPRWCSYLGLCVAVIAHALFYIAGIFSGSH